MDPPANSWAANPENCVLILGIELFSCNGAEVKIPGVHTSSSRGPEDESNRTQINRALYFVDGTGGIVINRSKIIKKKCALMLDATQEVRISRLNESASNVTNDSTPREPIQCLLLQGRPINEKIVKHGPFVMNSSEEIQQAFRDYQDTKFGGWPWSDSGVVFSQERGRFARTGGNDSEERPIQ